jgi:N-acetylmuramoyl-L-alanine amidase
MTFSTKQRRFIALWACVLPVILLLGGAAIPKTKPKGVKIIVIDPGHGGKDPGCNGASSNEKDVALAIGLKLGELLEKNLKDVKVIYTRKTDMFVELEERAQIANRSEADLFISIHCNAASVYATYKDKNGKVRYKTYKDKKGRIRKVEIHNPKPFGSATYVMGISNERGKLNTAKRENASMLLEDNYEKTYNGFDPESDEAYIIMSLWTGAFVEQSAGLASRIQDEYVQKAGRVDKGVQRQSIWVLWRTAMPSVLTEVGFLTNPEEEKFLGSEKGQLYMASALFRAIRKYKDEAEGQVKKYDDDLEKQEALVNENLSKGNKNEDSDEAPDSTKIAEANIEEKYNAALKLAEEHYKNKNYEEAGKLYTTCNELKPEEKFPLARIEECKKKSDEQKKAKADAENAYNQLIAKADKLAKEKKYNDAIDKYHEASVLSLSEKYPGERIAELEKLKKQEAVVKETVKEPVKDTVVTPKNIINGYKDNTPKTASSISFKVQFAMSETVPDFASQKFKSLEDLAYYKSGSVYKITAGNFLDPDDAISLQNKMRSGGYKDCFVVAFKNGQRVDYKLAVKELGKTDAGQQHTN